MGLLQVLEIHSDSEGVLEVLVGSAREVSMPDREWPVKPCKHCGRPIRLVRTKEGMRPFEEDVFSPHRCDPLDNAISWGGPKTNKYEKQRPGQNRIRRDDSSHRE